MHKEAADFDRALDAMPNYGWTVWRWGFFLIILAIASYLPAVQGGFVWQDDHHITGNPLLRSLAGLGRIWSDPSVSPRFAPLGYSLAWVEYHLWGNDPTGFHVVSILLHAANVLLLWTLLRKLHVPAAWFAAALFAVHPIQAEAVAWASQQPVVLCAFFFIAGLIVYLGWAGVYDDEESNPLGEPGHLMYLSLPESPTLRYAVAMTCAVGAMLSHPIGVAWPLVVAMITWWKRSDVTRADLKALAPTIALAIAVAACTLFWPSTETRPLAAAARGALAAGPVVVTNVIKTLVPIPFVMHVEIAESTIPLIARIALLAVVIAAIAFLWFSRRRFRRETIVIVVLFLAITLIATTLSRRGADSAFALDKGVHYLAIVLLFIPAAIWLRRRVSSLAQNRWISLTAGGTAIAALAVMTFFIAPRYADASGFWTSIISDRAGEAYAQRQLGDLAARQGESSVATGNYQAALRLDPRDVEAAVGLAHALDQQFKRSEAADTLAQALKQSPDDAQLLTALAQLDAQAGRIADAHAHYTAAVKSRAQDPRIRNDFGLFLAARGDLAAAEAQFRAAIAASSHFLPARINLATTLFQQQQYDAAAAELQAVVRIDPNNFEAYVNAGAMLAQMKQYTLAERQFRSALAIRSDSPEVWKNLASTLAAQGRYDEAKWTFNQASRVATTQPSETQ